MTSGRPTVDSLPDEPLAREYIAWLHEDHLARVLGAGARSAEVIRLDSAGPARVEGAGGGPPAAGLDREITTRH